MPSVKQICKAAPQLSYDTSTGTGSYINFSGALTKNPASIIFDNQSNVAVTISDDGTTDFKTFSVGEALVLDCEANKASSEAVFYWPIGTQFAAKSAAGTGSFYISYVYAK